MQFEVTDANQIGLELRRICLELMEKTRLALEEWENDSSASIHDLRTNMKRIRATLRLAKDGLPPRKLSTVVRLIRSVKDCYGPIRDEEMMKVMLLEVAGESVEGQVDSLFSAAAKQPKRPSPQFFKKMDRLTKSIAALPFEQVTLLTVYHAFSLTLKRGKAAMKKCKKRGDRLSFHNWRKRVKDTWYQSTILASIENLEMETSIAKEVGDYLGEGNDLSNLKLRLKNAGSVAVPKWVIKAVRRALKHSRRCALSIGEKFYEIGTLPHATPQRRNV